MSIGTQQRRIRFSLFLRRVRLELGWTQGKFAAEMGVRQRSVSFWECAYCAPRKSVRQHIAVKSIALLTKKRDALTVALHEINSNF
jgi:transcriptional regulator with XRE-family HTH domain